MRARTRGRAHARDGLDKKRGVPGGGPHPPTWSRTRGWDLAENRAALRRPVAVRGGLRRPVAVWGALRRPVAVWAALRRPVAVWGGLRRPVAVWGGLRRPVAVWGGLRRPVAVWGGLRRPVAVWAALRRPVAVWAALRRPVAVWAALRRPVAVWGHLAPREPSGPLSGVLWPFGGIWPPESRLGRSPASCGRLGASGPQRAVWAALRRPVAVWGGLRSQGKGTEAENGLGAEIERRIFERSRHFGKHGSAHLYKLRLSGWFASILSWPRQGCALPWPLAAGEGATRPLQSPESRQGGCKTFLPLPWEGDVSQVLPPSISVRSGPAASLAALRASGPAMCVATLGFIA